MRYAPILALILCLATPALAETLPSRIVAELRDAGFEDIEVNRTLLGRVRIVARDGRGVREIVVAPSSGLILRDVGPGAGDIGQPPPGLEQATP